MEEFGHDQLWNWWIRRQALSIETMGSRTTPCASLWTGLNASNLETREPLACHRVSPWFRSAHPRSSRWGLFSDRVTRPTRGGQIYGIKVLDSVIRNGNVGANKRANSNIVFLFHSGIILFNWKWKKKTWSSKCKIISPYRRFYLRKRYWKSRMAVIIMDSLESLYWIFINSYFYHLPHNLCLHA